MPFLAGSSALSSGHQYVARRTQSEVVWPVMSSPYREAAIEYRRTEFGLPFFGLVPGAMTPADWPSQYGILPKWSMMMWHVSPVACATTIRFVETTLPVGVAVAAAKADSIFAASIDTARARDAIGAGAF